MENPLAKQIEDAKKEISNSRVDIINNIYENLYINKSNFPSLLHNLTVKFNRCIENFNRYNEYDVDCLSDLIHENYHVLYYIENNRTTIGRNNLLENFRDLTNDYNKKVDNLKKLTKEKEDIDKYERNNRLNLLLNDTVNLK